MSSPRAPGGEAAATIDPKSCSNDAAAAEAVAGDDGAPAEAFSEREIDASAAAGCALLVKHEELALLADLSGQTSSETK